MFVFIYLYRHSECIQCDMHIEIINRVDPGNFVQYWAPCVITDALVRSHPPVKLPYIKRF